MKDMRFMNNNASYIGELWINSCHEFWIAGFQGIFPGGSEKGMGIQGRIYVGWQRDRQSLIQEKYMNFIQQEVSMKKRDLVIFLRYAMYVDNFRP